MPSPRPFSVLVYSGPGTSQLAISQTISTLSSLLLPYFTVTALPLAALLSSPWPMTCALFVMPGGRDIPYHNALSGAGNERIRGYVEGGGSYLGFCAGGYYATDEVRFAIGDEKMQVLGKRDLKFFEGSCEGPVYEGFEYGSEKGARAVELEVDGSIMGKGEISKASFIYYNGGGHFVFPTSTSSARISKSSVLARYASIDSKSIAAVLSTVGKGRSLLFGVHPEYSLLSEPLKTITSYLQPAERKAAEEERLTFMRAALKTLGIERPGDAESATTPLRPLPQVLVSHPRFPQLAKETVALLQPCCSAGENGSALLKDANDSFTFIASSSLSRPLSSIVSQLRSLPLEDAEGSDLHALPKTVVVVDSQLEPAAQWSPHFDLERYWAELDDERSKLGGSSGEKVRFADVMLYSEAVTSTQTMLDKCVSHVRVV